MKLGGCLALVLGMFVLAFAMSLICAIPVYFLWNWLVPDITKEALTPITFWQAWGISFLCSMLFKSSASSSSDSKSS